MSEFSGTLAITAAIGSDGRTRLATQSFRAPYHLSKGYWDEDAKTLLVQVVNPTAGILAGDRLDLQIGVETGAALLVTTPSVSRIFKMEGGEAVCAQRFSVADGGWLEVMPEPLVPHRGSSYRQLTSVELAGTGELFFVDQLAAGRIAHGEAWDWDRLCFTLNIRQDGKLLLRERFDQRGEELRELARLCGSGPTACFANAVLISKASETEPSWKPAISALHGEGLWLGVSALQSGGWSLKLVAVDSIHLRRGLREVRRILSAFFPHLACDPRKL
jgi:urease accessory protein